MKTTLKTIKDSNGNTIALEIDNVNIRIDTHKKSWTAFSPHFKAYGYSSESEEAAIDDLQDSIAIFFRVHSDRGTLEQALMNFGWKKVENRFRKPKYFNQFPMHSGTRLRELAIA